MSIVQSLLLPALALARTMLAIVAIEPDARPAVPAPSPSATATAAPKATSPALTFDGRLRAYYFVRQNAQQNAANPNRSAFLTGGTIHAEYRFRDSPFRLGASYTAADPLGTNGSNPQSNSKIDNSLPGFALRTFDQAYASYRTPGLRISLGDRVLNLPWYPASDGRLKPASYQGLDASGHLSRNVSLELTRIIRFENRTSSLFTANTLLTSLAAGNPPGVAIRNTSGALRVGLRLRAGPITARLENNEFYDLANLSYAEIAYAFAPHSLAAPSVSMQYVVEHQSGRAYLGRIANDTIGFSIGAHASKSVSLTFGFDSAPAHYAIVQSSSLARAVTGYFVPTGGTTAAALVSKGVYRVAYGGIASPYTYATDPLYTTTLTDGMVLRRSPGNSYKLTLAYESPDRRFHASASEAYFQYDNALAQNRTFGDVIGP